MRPPGEAGPEPRPELSWRRQTPLGLITLFVTLTETGLGALSTQTSGAVQMLLTIFVVTFPVAIASAFFAILWNRPHHLYHPSEYAAGTTAEMFERATRPRPSDLYVVRALLSSMVDTMDAVRAKALVTSVVGRFAGLDAFIAAQYSDEIRASDADGAQARTALRRLIVLTVHGTDDVETWQDAIGSLRRTL